MVKRFYLSAGLLLAAGGASSCVQADEPYVDMNGCTFQNGIMIKCPADPFTALSTITGSTTLSPQPAATDLCIHTSHGLVCESPYVDVMPASPQALMVTPHLLACANGWTLVRVGSAKSTIPVNKCAAVGDLRDPE